ncbi:hypothetical protein [Bradyrhizobium sp. NP1]|uniref:hypothetical protein n=1 Tax=Bradyrhizobium sp. NP1 TaxID=3049772 RepID=UPI0025A54736|nr:hypothetical protein [Bradyrhizobium sp. NP1]WJR75454.1 hypothetical protein QOU61_21920 [Bradyrhizobium sp. NP1]
MASPLHSCSSNCPAANGTNVWPHLGCFSTRGDQSLKASKSGSAQAMQLRDDNSNQNPDKSERRRAKLSTFEFARRGSVETGFLDAIEDGRPP